MSYPRHSVELSGYPDLTVVYLGYRPKSLKGLRAMLRIGRGLGGNSGESAGGAAGA